MRSLIKKEIVTRASQRVPTTASGSCKTDGGNEWELSFEDLSSGGCRVDDPDTKLALGSYVSLSIAGTGPHRAEVAWRQADRVGLEFLRPLPPRVFKHLAAEEWDLANDAHVTDSTSLPIRRMI